jgi:hypothetical protein
MSVGDRKVNTNLSPTPEKNNSQHILHNEKNKVSLSKDLEFKKTGCGAFRLREASEDGRSPSSHCSCDGISTQRDWLSLKTENKQ